MEKWTGMLFTQALKDQLLTQILNGFSTEYTTEFLKQMIICIKER